MSMHKANMKKKMQEEADMEQKTGTVENEEQAPIDLEHARQFRGLRMREFAARQEAMKLKAEVESLHSEMQERASESTEQFEHARQLRFSKMNLHKANMLSEKLKDELEDEKDRSKEKVREWKATAFAFAFNAMAMACVTTFVVPSKGVVIANTVNACLSAGIWYYMSK